MTTYTKLELNIGDGVAKVRLSNPPLNVIDIPMMRQLQQAMGEIEQRADVSVLIFCGSERAFSAGVDVAAHTPDKVGEMLELFHGVIKMVVASRKVTMAAVLGSCFGGGAELAMVCDMVFSAPHARWAFPEIKLGCFPPVACAALSAVVGQKHAADLILTGRQIDGQEAQSFGLVNEALNDAEGRAMEFASSLTKLSPASLAITKKAMGAWNVAHFDKELAKAEKIYLEELMKSEDAHEGIKAFMEKRPAKWSGK